MVVRVAGVDDATRVYICSAFLPRKANILWLDGFSQAKKLPDNVYAFYRVFFTTFFDTSHQRATGDAHRVKRILKPFFWVTYTEFVKLGRREPQENSSPLR